MDGSGGGGGKLQWFSMRGNGGSAPAGQQGGPAFGNGALRFIRTRASARAKRASPAANRSKSGEKGAACHQSSSPSSPATTAAVVPPSSTLPTSTSHHHDSVTTTAHQGGGGGFGRWLREHLTVTHHHNHQSAKINDGKLSKQQRELQQLQLLPSQNLYCSLPRERPARRFDHRRASCRIVTREIHQQQHQQVVLVQTTEDKDEGGRRRTRTTTTKAERRRHSMSEFHSEQHRSSVRRSRRCFPDGGEVGYKMTTELQPSPPGYRGAGKDECAPGGKLYSRHLGYNGAGPEYPRRRESQSPEQLTELGAKIVDGYEEQGNYCKKNAPGYKNDSGYSESLGFESFSLPLSERDAASPPPTPPVRDASSLKGVCYGPGHEKYPSWPSAPECRYTSGNEDDEDGPGQASLQQHAGGSHRSKSWTDHTNYPKEKPAQYTRPHTKRPNATFTQQLKTVMERCEKIPAETFESRQRGDPDQQQQLRMWPTVDREGKTLGDAEYVVPSPPERESHQAKTLSPADLEAYVRSYQDPQVSQVELYGESDLTQTGLDEYTTVQHSQQASYAQSEGYHSYVSSVDSTTTTPFLDRLRRDSEAVTQRPLTSWEDGSSREGRDSVVTTSSGSASSSETLKWHGSMSDVSVSSGMPTSRSSGIAQDRWHHGSMSDVSSINGAGPMVHKPDDHDKWQDSIIDNDHHHGNQNNHHHSSSKRDNWQVSMNDRNKEHGTVTEDKWEHSGHAMSKSFHLVLDRSSIITDQSGGEWEHSIHSSMSDVSQSNGSGGTTQGSKQLIAHSSRVQTPQRHHSESVLYLDRERSQRKLYPVSTTKLDDAHTVSRLPASSPQQAQPSVADRINELEKQQHLQQQQMRYTYLDPDKRHRVSDPTLKAIQKKALLSFYERHQHQASWRSEPHLLLQNQQLSQQRHSPPPQPPPRPRPVSSRRASSASDYASGGWREKSESSKAAQQQPPSSSTSSGGSSSAANSDLPTPRHQHSNSCGSLSTDLLGPVIVGPAISIDDWVPERPPKKPHLRSAYSDRLPSPDLPPPSPPTVTDVEVINFDDPLPPPPPELSQICTAEPRMASPEQRRDNSYFEEPPSDRIKERNSSSRRSSRKKHIAETTSPTTSPTKAKSSSPKQDQHSFHFECKPLPETKSHVENGFSASRLLASGRSSLRFSSTQKHVLNEKIAAVRRAAEDRLAPYGLADQLPDLIAQKYSDSGNQRPAPQVPVGSREAQAEPKIKRQESLSLDETKQSWLDAHSARQKPRPQAPKTSPTSPTSPPINHRGSSKYNQQQRTYFALPPKYTEAPKPQSPPSHERYGEAASAPVAAPRSSPPPPPLAPRKKMSPPPRPAPPVHAIHQGSQSKASYLAYRRERGAPDSEGSYKRTMSPNARLDDPVLLKVTPHHQQSLLNNNTSSSNNNNNNNNPNNNNNNNNVNNVNNAQYHGRHHRHELSKSQSSDALQQHHNSHQPHHNSQHHHRLDDHFSRKSMHNVSSSTDLDNSRSLENVNSRSDENGLRRTEKRERLSPQSVEVLNDRNRQLERERRKLAASCEPQSRLVEDFYRESAVTTIEMTSQNVEMLNRRNVAEKQRVAAAEGRSPTSGSPKLSESPTSRSPPTTTTTSTSTEPISDRKISSPAQTDQSGSSWDRKSTSTISSSSSSSSSSSNSNSSSPLRTSPSESQVEKSSPRVSPQPGVIEGLTLVQRTEVVLRVNAPTNDVASQTEIPDEVNEENKNKQKEDETTAKEEKLTESLAKPRKKLPEEIECEELSRDLANQLGPNDKLLPILVPVPEHKKSTDYVSDLFRVETALQPRPRPRLSIVEPTLLEDNEPEDAKKIDSIPTTPVTPSATDSSATANSPLSANSAYFTTSEGKARFLTRYSQDVGEQQNATAANGNGGGNSSGNATPDSIDLRQKKEELMVRLDKKLVVLRAEQEAVREEGDVNEALGARVSSRVSAVAQPAEASKYRLHVEEVGKITSLLLSLSGRLARAENALYGMAADHAERKILESKRDKLIDQLEEAKILKGNIDRRSVNVSALLSRYLTDEEFADYQHFINMKAKLIVDGREIQDKVKLGEEQLAALKEAIDL